MKYARKSKKSQRSTVKRAIRKVKQTNLNRSIKRVLSRNAETKIATYLNIADQLNVPSAGLNNVSGLGLTLGSIIPAISPGANDGQRIGNVISVKRLSFKYTIRAVDVSLNTGNNPFPALPFLVRVVAYSHKIDKTDNSNTGILETGSGSQNLGSTPDFWIEPYNKREFNIHYSKTYLMQPVRTIFAGAGYQSDNIANGAKQFVARKVNLKNIPKKFLYNDASTAPSNCGVYLGFACCNIDGSVITAPNARAMVNAETYLTYQDF